MRLRCFFLIFAILIVGIWVALFFIVALRDTLWFYIIEAGLAVTLIYLIVFYRKVMAPINTLSGGIDMLRAQDWNSTLRRVGHKEVDDIVDTFNFMLERLKAQRIRYEEQGHMLHLLIENIDSGVIVTDPYGVIVMSNPSADSFMGKAIATVGTLSDIDSPMAAQLLTLHPGEVVSYRSGGGDNAVVRCSCHGFINAGVPYRFYILHNITDTVIESERQGYEKVIRVMSHEVNNTVGGLVSAMDTLMSMLPDRDVTDVLRACSDRARNLSDFVSRYASVAKIPVPVLTPTDLHVFFDRADHFIQSVASAESVPVFFDIPDNLSKVMLDAILFEQVMVNTVKNAAESMSAAESYDPIIVSAAENDDGTVTVTVTDSGTGITPEKQKKLFTPFYTDKPAGQGLGLMSVRDILRSHGCRFSLYTSAADRLTRFTITFPHYGQ
ncbi:MAG: ATP-binding protein [Muribaculaceae bacterium]|nr:ATP-binding protein [Muribaculaceae bacterium]